MSGKQQHKMYNYEVTPPPAVWEKIATDLDDAALSHSFPNTLLQAEAAPPSHVWDKISGELDEQEEHPVFAGKLYAYEVVPPVNAWEKIRTALDADAGVTPMPQRKRALPVFLRYAAAAAIIALLAFGATQLFSKDKADAPPVTADEKKIITPVKEATTPPADQVATTDNIPATETPAEEARNNAALEESKKLYASLDGNTAKEKLKNAANFYFNAPEEIIDEQPADLSKRYIMLMTPDGNIIRMSKKLSGLVCCVSGEEQDENCTDQLKKWQEQMANPSDTHSPGNFMDILTIVSSLQNDN